MSVIRLDLVSFHFDGCASLFHDQNLHIDTSWKTGLIGRNGRGKTTLLRLISGTLKPAGGSVSVPVNTYLFPYKPADPGGDTLRVVRESIAPFAEWEAQMNRTLEIGTEESMHTYAETHEQFDSMGGYLVDGLIEREFARLHMEASLLSRPFCTLSGGEQTRALIAALFLRRDAFPLIDEPTNHLDMDGRDILGRYLSQKDGFILVSHDRYFLDLCVDHVVSIGTSGISVVQGDYSSWRYNRQLKLDYESAVNDKLKREIGQIRRAFEKRRSWADRKEKEKLGAADKGYIGHKSAKLMKRALSLRRRVEERIEEKRGLLKDRETEYRLHLEVATGSPAIPLQIDNLSISIENRSLFDALSLIVHREDRVAIVGPNGCGKTSLLNAIMASCTQYSDSLLPDGLEITGGSIHIPGYLTVVRSFQIPRWTSGLLEMHLEEEGLDMTQFRTIMGELGFSKETFTHPLETFSEGELKKVDLCLSLCTPAHLVLWDEPLNYLDITSREQLEESLLEHKPTLLFVEHDRYFVGSVATKVVELG